MKRRRRSARGRYDWLPITVGITLIMAIIGGGIYLKLGARPTDRETGCPKDHYDGVTAVLVDLTDKVSPVQAAALRNEMFKVRDGIPKFGRLEIYTLDSMTDKPALSKFARCSPGSGREVDNSIYGNPELADRFWKEKFANEVDTVIESLGVAELQDSSPLFEGIHFVAVTAFGGSLSSSAEPKRLIIISDMIHHTEDLSLYKGVPEFGELERTSYYSKIKPRLRGAKVDIFLIVRSTARNVQRLPLLEFWADFVEASGGRFGRSEPLQ